MDAKGSAGLRFLRDHLGSELPEVGSAWAALVDPAETQIYFLQFAEDATAAGHEPGP